MDPTHFRAYLVRPVLRALGLWSPAAETLLLGTALAESRLKWLRQLGGGPARGLYQCEPATHDDIWANYLRHKPDLAQRVRALRLPLMAQVEDVQQLEFNPAYATAICRVHYLRKPQALPPADDAPALGRYWKDQYNTHLGRGDPAKFAALLRPYID